MKCGPYEVQVRVCPRARRMVLHLNPTVGEIRVSVPRGVTEAQICAFVLHHDEWLRRQMGPTTAWTPRYARGERHWCLGRLVTLGVDAPVGEETFHAWRLKQFRQVVDRLVQLWSMRMGVTLNGVKLRKMTRCWGNCAVRKRVITFNTDLALFDEALIEETVVHELCHLFHSGHGAAFRSLMTRWLPDWPQRKACRDAAHMQPLPPL